MILADLGQTWGPIVAGLIALAIAIGLGFFILKGYRWYRSAAERAMQRTLEGTQVSTVEIPGSVEVVFHTYYGLVAFVTQTEYRFWAPPNDARLILSRMNRFNLTWGSFAYGALFIPILSLGNYWTQLRRVKKQVARRGDVSAQPEYLLLELGSGTVSHPGRVARW